METNIQAKKVKVTKRAAKVKTVGTDPFASAVEVKAAKKSSSKKATEAVSEAVAVKKIAKKNSKTIITDPFAEVVEVSSTVKKRTAKALVGLKTPKKTTKKIALDVTAEIAATKLKVELSPTFKALAEVSLPELQRENRARLQMQSPSRLYFYWSIKENPWAMLKSVFGDDTGSYTMVVKLIDIKHDREDIKQCDAEGTWWFDVEPNHTYQAEIGFYAPNRPYFRILHSNTVKTPRRSPSPRAATESNWTMSANKFAEVLDVAGFSRDAFDVVMAGDDPQIAVNTSQTAFSSFLGESNLNFDNICSEDIRYAMLALASGVTLTDLRGKISPTLFALLQANVDKIHAKKAMNSLVRYFDIDEVEFAEQQLGSAIYGASLVNFPRTLQTRVVSAVNSPRYNPVSSHSLR